MANAISGATTLLDGFNLITKPGLRRFVLLPLFINLIFFIAMFFLFQHFVHQFNVWLASYLPSWLAWLSTILWIIFLFCFFIFFIYTFVVIANIIAAPFNALLSQKVEIYLTGKTHHAQSTNWLTSFKDFPRSIARQFAIIGYYLPRVALIVVLFFIPVIQIFAAFIWFLFNAWFMALTYLDYPSDNHQVSFVALRDWMHEHSSVGFVFGLSILIASMIPFVNFFVMPAAVASATKLWLEENKHVER